MATTTRNHALDYQRGLACLLMIFAHLKLANPDNPVMWTLRFIGELAPMLFFTVSGYNASRQAQQQSLSQLFAINGALFLFGITYSIITRVDMYERFVLELFQIIAVGSLFTAIVSRQLKDTPWPYLAIAIALFALKLGFDQWLPAFDGGGIVLTSNDYVPHHLLTGDQQRMYPGFALLPWIAFFCLGVFIGGVSNQVRLVFAVVCAGLLELNLALGIGGHFAEKWDMSLN